MTFAKPFYVGQTRPDGAAEWSTVAPLRSGNGSIAEAAFSLNDHMERAGFRFNELSAHRADLVDGHVLGADNGRQFRVIVTL